MGTAWDIDAAEGRGVLTVNYGIEGDDFDPLTQVPRPPFPHLPTLPCSESPLHTLSRCLSTRCINLDHVQITTMGLTAFQLDFVAMPRHLGTY